ncbi:MAG: metalloregulator ArsR/SmtB family transcription factor [Victivallaceae bacterium]|nr:metalloregulator ArsR/SmtB family transcription factor [Victivallaceae bacterium]
MDNMISILKALSDRNRLKIILALILYPELCACRIIELLQVTGATASRHLDILFHSGLLDRRKEGRWVYYRLKTQEKKLEPLINWIKNEFSKSKNNKEFLADLKKAAAYNLKTGCGNKS